MLYWFLWCIVKFSLKFSFRKIELRGLEHLPKNTPVIFTSNHPVGFMEPLVLATHIPRSLNYLARGDFFKKPLFRWLLNQIHILPIYRFRDGFSDMRNNEQAMQNAIDLLKSGKSFLVFVEGSTKLQYSFRPIQKGVARIVHQMLEDDPEANIAVVPIGYSDSDMTRLGSNVFVNIAKPIYPHSLYKSATSKPIFLKQLTKKITESSHANVPQLDLIKDEALLQKLVSILPANEQTFNKIKSAADQINKTEETNKARLNDDIDAFKNKLGKVSSNTSALFQPLSIFRLITLVFGSIPALLGRLFHFLPMWIAKTYANNTIKKSEFYMVTVFVVRFVLVGLLYIILFVILKFLGVQHAFFILLAFALLGTYAIYYVKEAKTMMNHFRLGGRKESLRKEYFRITNQIFK
jgi:1-acyl-sn-glycerol-3-phosphate acyltransferase